jgi:hypothetical protein
MFVRSLVESASNHPLPALPSIQNAINKLPHSLPATGLGDAATQEHLLSDITPGLNGPKTSSNYYGFVTGGVFPIAEVAGMFKLTGWVGGESSRPCLLWCQESKANNE